MFAYREAAAARRWVLPPADFDCARVCSCVVHIDVRRYSLDKSFRSAFVSRLPAFLACHRVKPCRHIRITCGLRRVPLMEISVDRPTDRPGWIADDDDDDALDKERREREPGPDSIEEKNPHELLFAKETCRNYNFLKILLYAVDGKFVRIFMRIFMRILNLAPRFWSEGAEPPVSHYVTHTALSTGRQRSVRLSSSGRSHLLGVVFLPRGQKVSYRLRELGTNFGDRCDKGSRNLKLIQFTLPVLTRPAFGGKGCARLPDGKI